jgi:hypothetical protein
MMKTRSLPKILILLPVLLMLAMLPGQTSSASAVLPSHQSARPAAVLADPADWPMYGHDYQRTNYNPAEAIINPGNVGQLVQRWQMSVGTNGTGTSAAPGVANGVVYVGSSAASPNDNFFAFDATTGSTIWHENIGYRSSCFNVGIGSSPAISGTQVVVGQDNAQNNPAYNGIDTVTGTKVWTNTMSVGSSGFPWESPFLYNGRAYVGIASRCDNPSVRGELRAVDMTNGNAVAHAYFVGAGEAGGGIWNSPALTPDGSIVAVGTGEDYSCSDCSLTRAMVTMDSSTLAILQHFQEPSPNADLDFGTSAIIFHDSQGRTLVAAGHKNNNFYAYDITNVNSGPIWTHGGGTTVGLMPAYDPNFGSGGTLFIVTGSILAVDPANGSTRWGPISIGSSHGNIAIANGLIFVNTGSGGLQIRDESNGSLLRTLSPPSAGAANSGVAVSHGFIYWISGSYVNAWSLPASGTPSPTDTALAGTPTSTFSPTSTNIPTNTPTNTHTGTPTVPPTSTRTSTPTHTPTRTNTPSPTNTPLPTQTPGGATATPVPSDTPTPTRSPTTTPVAATATFTPTPLPTQTPGGPTATPVPSDTPVPTLTPVPPSATPTACTLSFSDVPLGSTFYPYIRCLACLGIVNGYPDGTFKPNNNVTRGQLSKIVSNSAGFNDNQTTQMFQDVPVGSTFFAYIGRLASRGYINGYACGGPGEPCQPGNLPYFRPNNPATRGQISKIVSNAAGFNDPPSGQQFQDVPAGSTFYDYIYRLATRDVMQGYQCGGHGEPCIPPGFLPYFRPNNNATRGQTSKIVSNTFFPGCNPPVR